jgi:hypothetical protein
MVHSCAAVRQSCLDVAKGHLAQNAVEQAGKQVTINFKKPVIAGPKSKLNGLKNQ